MGARVTYSGTQVLSAGALSLVTNVAARGLLANAGVTPTVANVRRLIIATLKAAADITQTVTLTLNSAKGAAFDVVLNEQNLNPDTSYLYLPDGDLVLGPGDNLTLTCTATGSPAITVSAQILLEE